MKFSLAKLGIRGPAAFALAAGLLASALPSVADAQSADAYEVDTVRYVHSGIGVDPFELAYKLGYLDPLKIERAGDASGLGGGPANIQAVATLQIDLGAAFNGTIAKVVSVGVPVKAIIGYYGQDQHVTGSLAVLEDSDIKSARDLVGKKIGLNTLGANSEALVDSYLEKSDITKEELDQITLVPLPQATLEQALRQKQIAAARLNSFATKVAQQRGGIRLLTSDYELLGAHNGGSYVLSNAFIEKNPKTTAKIVEGIAKAVRYIQEKPVEEVRALYAEYFRETGRADQVAALDRWEGLGVSSPGGVLGDDDFRIWVEWLEQEKEVDPVWRGRISEFYTNEFNPFKND